jgi:predicted permease
MNGRVLLFTFIAAVLGTLGMGLMPSLQSTTGDLVSCIRTGARTIVGGRATGLQRGLVGVQLLVATVLLTGGGLMLRSYLALAGANPGYDVKGVYMLETELPQARYRASPDAARFYGALVDTLNGAGAVGAAAVAGGTHTGRTGTQGTGSFEDVELPGDAASTRSARVEQVVVSSRFFETLGVPLKLGRSFRPNDPGDTAIVTEEFARRYWPSASPLEQSIGVHGADGLTLVRVIGVAGDMRDAFAGEGAAAQVRPRVYLPLHFGISLGATVYARGAESADGNGVAFAMRTAVNALDRDQAVWAATSLADFLAVTRSPVKWFGYLLGACSLMASVVACVGLYGVVSHAVRRRQREFAIRAAFGASPFQVVGIVLRDALWPSAVGLGLGIVGGAVLGKALSTLLYGVPAFDPLVTSVTAVSLVSAILLASVIPAVRLSRLDPSVLLRAD